MNKEFVAGQRGGGKTTSVTERMIDYIKTISKEDREKIRKELEKDND
jgi:hypothetical protein